MAGHSHWAGIKHKKGRQDKERAKLFSKLSREITVAAKLGLRILTPIQDYDQLFKQQESLICQKIILIGP